MVSKKVKVLSRMLWEGPTHLLVDCSTHCEIGRTEKGDREKTLGGWGEGEKGRNAEPGGGTHGSGWNEMTRERGAC